MSLMFPTIFGLSLRDLGSDSKFGGSFLIMAILGGAVLTAIMGQISDAAGIGAAFIIPLVGFVYLVYYGAKGYQVK
jgi:FHS family L-fucose permease-like MFS transporter